jgi:4-diphosphocytidyl-2-C-methyl-D-erythritol kinase
MSRLQTLAPAKVNLTLRVLSRRGDGFHDLASLVAFASVGDEVALEPAPLLDLQVDGPQKDVAGPDEDNLVLKAARALAASLPRPNVGRFILTKRLPSGAGLGGGSSDAAAALRLLAQLNDLPISDPHVLRAARETGADVAVCVDRRARLMHGLGDELSDPIALPELATVIVYPGAGTATGDVFRQCKPGNGRKYTASEIPKDRGALLSFLARESNDLERAATSLLPAVGDARKLLEQTEQVELIRMSGSGSAMFAIYSSEAVAAKAAAKIRGARPDWWVVATTLG